MHSKKDDGFDNNKKEDGFDNVSWAYLILELRGIYVDFFSLKNQFS